MVDKNRLNDAEVKNFRQIKYDFKYSLNMKKKKKKKKKKEIWGKKDAVGKQSLGFRNL